ncbi:probable WRKY transcription factor 20 isoform X1 [Olea europaea var. sylvestris]|uniref:probable WRKY transcription factor 20 isoform X1 n=1 Tax=Olea europaea var. sylvestris TaxID=158386 RepID=UPI000C1D5432|nr:probable WRKY transcription factor 20 isoform X1 [Olea europaea var. sylvestris]
MAEIEGPFVKQDQFDSNPLLDNNQENKSLKLETNQEIYVGLIQGSNSNQLNEFSPSDWNSNKGSIAERRAAKCGFNAPEINASRFSSAATTGLVVPPMVRSPCFTIPPDISPAALLDSPVMLPNAQAQLSPTTGTFQFPPCNLESLSKFNFKSKAQNDLNLVSSRSSAGNKPPENFENSSQLLDAAKGDCSAEAAAKTEVSRNKFLDADCPSSQFNITNAESDDKESGPRLNLEKDPKSAYFSKEVSRNSEDGYNWRKYGQKHVKGSEFPRSYFKCTNTNCPVKKKVERSHDGQITEIVYKSSHNHPKPQPFRRYELQETSEGSGSYLRAEGRKAWRNIVPGCRDTRYGSDWRPHGLDRMSSTSLLRDFSYPPLLSEPMNLFETGGTPQFPSPFASQDGDIDKDEATLDSTSFDGDDDDNDEFEPKRRKKNSFPIETTISSRSTREPRVVVQIESDIDILDDGYRWRKYGQKVVKGNPNPRSYYKCTAPGCPVRKHIERAADNLKSVITTYEGKHNHEVPSSKTGNLVISSVANLPPAVTNSNQSASSSLSQDSGISKVGMQVQDLPLYLERKPVFSNECTSSNFLGNFVSDMNFGASSIYQFASPPSHSVPYGTLLMSANDLVTYQSSNIYPMVSDYMRMPLPMNHLPGSGNIHLGNFHFGNHIVPNGVNIQASIQRHPLRECYAKIQKPKEEQKDNDDNLYEA